MIAQQKPAVWPGADVLPEIAGAQWIWTNDDPDETDVWVYARRRFDVPDGVEAAYINIAADLRYMLWVNGRAIGFGPAKSHIETPCLDRHSISDFLQPGENTVCVLVYSFGAVGYVNAIMPRRGALLASIECDGHLVVTDSKWKVQREHAYRPTGVRINENQPFATHFDSRASLGKPWRPDYDDSDWQSATELSGVVFDPWHSIERRDIPILNWQTRPPERLYEWGVSVYAAPPGDILHQTTASEIAGACTLASNRGEVQVQQGTSGRPDRVICDVSSLPSDQGCYAVFDFGRIWTGYPVVTLAGLPGTVVDLSYAESLKDGRVDPSGTVYVDRVVLADDPLSHHILWPKSLRYLRVDVRAGKAIIEDVCLEASTYPVQRHGNFHCSDQVLDQAWEISAHTLQLCMEDSYMDTPWRERGAWLGDIVPEAHSNYYAFGDKALIRRFLIQHSRGQKPDGSMCGKYPGKTSSFIHTWNLTYAFALSDYLRHTGDIALTEDLWPTVTRIGEWLESYKTDEGLYGNFPLNVTPTINIYTCIDWAPVNTLGSNASLNAYAYAFWRACETIALRLERADEAQACALRAEELKERFSRLFWDDNRGCFFNGRLNGQPIDRFGIHENMLAVLFGLATPDQLSSILAKFGGDEALQVFKIDPNACEGLASVAIALNTYPWNSDQPVPVGTPYFAYWMLQGLCDLGLTQTALDFMRKYWGEFSRLGGTTVWEHWTSEGSLSHAWSSAPIVVLGKYIIGAFPSSDNHHIWNVFPERCDLTSAHGRIPTPDGVIDVRWTWDGRWKLSVNVPKGMSVNLGLKESEAAGLVLDGVPVASAFSVTHCNSVRTCVTVGEGRHVLESA